MKAVDRGDIRIGVDLGGTKIELIALDQAGHELLRVRKPTPVDDYAGTVALIVEMVKQAEEEAHANATVGIGTPGAISQVSGLMKNCNSTCLNGQPLQQDIERLLGRDIRLSNDANCFALSEAVDGAAAGAAIVFGVILGTGVGGGLVVHGSVLNGANSIGGEWGHNPLSSPQIAELPGPGCYCGRSGCIETWLSGPGLSADFQRETGRDISAEEMVEAALSGDQACREALQRYCDRLARSLAGVINIVDPDVIVLGGGLSNIQLLYEQVPRIWGEYIFSDAVRSRLLPPKYGDSSGVRGAAWLWGRE